MTHGRSIEDDKIQPPPSLELLRLAEDEDHRPARRLTPPRRAGIAGAPSEAAQPVVVEVLNEHVVGVK